MVSAYRTDLIPRWVWVILAAAALLVVLVLLSAAAAGNRRVTVVSGPRVRTGEPRDFVARPTETPTPPDVPAEPEAEPAPGATPQPTPRPVEPRETREPPAGMPLTFVLQGRTWRFDEGPVEAEVQTTGELTGEYIIYIKPGDTPPYDSLYLESAPNSGKFYRYEPGT